MKLDAKVPGGPIAEKWDRHKFEMKLVNPANKRKHTIIVVGTGLAGASAAASLGELGYRVLNFCIQDSPRRAHSIAAQGGINASVNTKGEGDSPQVHLEETAYGGDFLANQPPVKGMAEAAPGIVSRVAADSWSSRVTG